MLAVAIAATQPLLFKGVGWVWEGGVYRLVPPSQTHFQNPFVGPIFGPIFELDEGPLIKRMGFAARL